MGKPDIRFKGYTDEWEQRKVLDLLKLLTDYDANGSFADMAKNVNTMDGSGYAWYVRITDLENPKPLSELKYVDKLSYEFLKKTELHGGELLMAKRGDIGKVYIFEPRTKYATVAPNMYLLKLNNKVIPHFLYDYFVSDEGNKKLARLNASSTMGALYKDDVKNIDVIMPSIEEQSKIGIYFQSLDHLITLHQRKCDEVKSLKKYMLQKMFPQNEQKVPEIRFEGFTEAWEQRKLGDVAEFSKGSGYSKGDLIESGTPIILYGRLYTKYETIISDVDTFVEAKDGSVYSKGGEVIVPASGETAEDIARAASVDKSGILLGGDLNVVMPNEDINSAFLAISISNGSSQRELARKAQGKSVVHIHNEEIRNLIVPFPTKTEQNKIENYFADLDHLITLHQQKCEELKKIKKFMLQKMFV